MRQRTLKMTTNKETNGQTDRQTDTQIGEPVKKQTDFGRQTKGQTVMNKQDIHFVQ